MRRRRLWVVSELYYPEETSTGYFVSRIAEGLSASLDVHAVCSKPTYSERHLQVPARERHGGVEIHRVFSTRFDKDKAAGRIANLLSFTLSAVLFCLLRVKRGDRLLVLTNPPTLPPLIGAIARLKGARPSLLVHDVYPEVLVATGLLSAEGLPNRALGRLVSATYGLYETVIVLGRDMAEVARRRLPGREDRVSIIPNWGDVDEVRPLQRAENAFAQAYNPPGTTVIQFSGNLGRTHDVETVLEAADALAGREDILFQFVGGGGKAALIGEAARPGRVEHLPRQPREMLGGMLAGADAIVIAFVDRMLGVSVPSRMYNVMAAGTPIIAMAHPESELALVVREEECGWVLRPGDAAGLAALARHIATPEGKAEARRRGLRGRDAAIRRFSLPSVLSQFEALLAAN